MEISENAYKNIHCGASLYQWRTSTQAFWQEVKELLWAAWARVFSLAKYAVYNQR